MENVICGAPMLQELTLHHFCFCYPAMLCSYAMLVCENASKYGSLLKWHLDSCNFFPNMIAMLEQISTWEMAKSMWVTLKLSRENCQVLQAIMSDGSCVGALGVNYDVMQSNHLMPDGNPILEMLPLLQINHISSACPLTCVNLVGFSTASPVLTFMYQWSRALPFCTTPMHISFCTMPTDTSKIQLCNSPKDDIFLLLIGRSSNADLPHTRCM